MTSTSRQPGKFIFNSNRREQRDKKQFQARSEIPQPTSKKPYNPALYSPADVYPVTILLYEILGRNGTNPIQVRLSII